MTISIDQLKISYKNPCRFATTANINLATTGLTIIDGVTPVAGDRALVKNQSAGATNGIYVVSAGAWTRALDFNSTADNGIQAGLVIRVQEGTANGEREFKLDTTGLIILDTTSLVFTEASVFSAITASGNITMESGQIIEWIDTSIQRARITGASDGGIYMNADGTIFMQPGNANTVHFRSQGGMQVEEKSGAPSTVAGRGSYWVKDDVPNIPKFSSDSGTAYTLAYTSSSHTGFGDLDWTTSLHTGGANQVAYFDGAGAAADSANLIYDGTDLIIAAGNITLDHLQVIEWNASNGTQKAFLVGAPADSTGSLDLNADTSVRIKPGNAAKAYFQTGGGIQLTETAVATGLVAGRGTFWVKDDTPNTAMFLDDAGNSTAIGGINTGNPILRTTLNAATTANIADLAAGAPDPVDGVSLSVGDFVLVKDQSTGSENGVYVVDTVGTGVNGSWSRALFWNDAVKDRIEFGVSHIISGGTISGGACYGLFTSGVIVIGTTSLSFITLIPIGGGDMGSTDNQLVRTNGTTGGKLQNSLITIDDDENMANILSLNILESSSAPVAPGAGNGLYWVKNDVPSVPYFTDDTAADWKIAKESDSVIFDFVGTGLASGSALRVRSGESTGSTDSQILMSYNGGDLYQHRIVTTHDAATPTNNEVKFFLWDQTTDTSNVPGTLEVMSLHGDGLTEVFGDIQLSTDSSKISLFNGGVEEAYIDASSTALQLHADVDVNIFPGNTFQGSFLSGGGLRVVEQTSAPTTTAASGYFWVEDTTPNRPMFTPDDDQSQQVHLGSTYYLGSNSTIADDTTWVTIFSVNAATSTRYQFHLNLLVNANATDDIEMRLNLSTGSGGASYARPGTNEYIIAGGIVGWAGAGANQYQAFTGLINGGGGVDSIIQVQVRKQTDASTDATVGSESHMVITRIV